MPPGFLEHGVWECETPWGFPWVPVRLQLTPHSALAAPIIPSQCFYVCYVVLSLLYSTGVYCLMIITNCFHFIIFFMCHKFLRVGSEFSQWLTAGQQMAVEMAEAHFKCKWGVLGGDVPIHTEWTRSIASLLCFIFAIFSERRCRMSTCCWCTPGGISTVDFLKLYASGTLSSEFQTADEDLCYCLECVAEYHKARDELPFLHEVIFSRCVRVFRVWYVGRE